MARRVHIVSLLLVFACASVCAARPAYAGTHLTLSGPAQLGPISPDASGRFAFPNVPLRRNSVNVFTVTASDDSGQMVSRDVSITQLSLESVVVSKITAQPLSVQEVQQLVTEGVIALDNPENFNVSKFDIVLTIGQEAVPISVPIAMPKDAEQTGYEIYRLPREDGNGGGGKPRPQPVDIIIFQEYVAGPPEVPIPPVPGVLIIEGRIKTLKEFFSVRLLLMNASGIFTLSDVRAQISYPQGGLSSTLPADGLVAFGDILPGSGDQPGQLEREFIIRGDDIGVRPVKVEFGGFVTGPGIPEDTKVPFNGSAQTTVEVKGPPSFQVQVKHPPAVVTDVPYELTVDILNTGDTPALYASLELDVGADGQLVNCSVDDAGLPVCEPIIGAAVRNLGHIFPGQRTSQTFTINPLRTGVISSCMGVADQNIALQVYVGAIGCIVGRYPPAAAAPDGIPTVNVLPPANALGIGIDSPVTAFFSETMNLTTITTGVNGSFRVHDGAGAVVPGQLRFETINDKTVAIWQVNDAITNRLAGNTQYSVFLTQDVRDLQGNALFASWTSQFTTTSPTDDQTPPTLTLSIEPPVDPAQVLPGQVVRINAYAADQGTGVSRLELRRKDVDVPEATFELIDQKSQVDVLAGPVIFSVDSAALVPGHTYQFKATAYDGPGNAQDATIAVIVAPSVAPPMIVLPNDPPQPVLQGISVDLTPVAVSGTVKTVEFYVDGGAAPFRTLTVPPFQTSLPTLTLALGDHRVRAVAIDGLGQTGEATLTLTLAANASLPVVSFGSAIDGAQYVVGTTFPVAGSATDAVGLESVRFYLDAPGGTPVAVGTQPFTVDTAGLGTGPHQVIIVATNRLGVSNDPSDPASVLEFAVVPVPTGPPPSPPVLLPLAPPSNGHVSVQGASVPWARIDVTNLGSGLLVSVTANGGGTFAATIDAAAGDPIQAVAYDFTQSQEPSAPAQAVVPSPPLLDHIEVTPASFTLSAPTAYRDLTVTGHYADTSTANLTGSATFVSGNPAVAAVSAAGRVAAIANGTATITAQVGDKQAQANVTVAIVTLDSISVEPPALLFSFVGQTATLTVTAHFSDGSTQPVTGGLAFGTGDPAVATVNLAGVVRAVADGSTQVSVAMTGVAPVIVPVSVATILDEAPRVSIVSPADGTAVERGELVSVVVQANDVGGGVARVEIAVTGATAYSEIRQITPPATATTVTFAFPVSRTAPVGGTITISVRAEDTKAQLSPVAMRTLTVADGTAPTVTIQTPASHTAYNFGDTVTVQVHAADAVGVSRIRLEVTGAFSASPSQTITPATTDATATFEIRIPYGLTMPDVTLRAFARDAAANEGASTPVPIEVTDADITPPETVVTAVASPGSAATTVVTYEVLSGLDDLDHVELYFRRNGLGTFNRYTNAAGGNATGAFPPPGGAMGTIVFDSTRMGGDGTYEFFTVGVDVARNREPAPRQAGQIVGDPGATTTFATGAEVAQITSDTELVTTAFDDRNLRISGATVTLVGPHHFHNVELLSGAVLTHRDTTTTDEYGLDVEAWTVTIDASSRIDVSGRGYLGGNRSGFGEAGATLGNVSGSPHGNGGSYGGLGGHYSGSGDQPNAPYGSLTDPAELGSGGGAWSGDGGDGGGRVGLDAINLVVDGAVRADGGVSAGSASGDGSGGSVNLVTRTVSGKGTLSANGGGNGSHTGGGGGRLAVRYLDLFTFGRERVTASGGIGYYGNGADGTVFFKEDTEPNGELILNGAGPGAPFTAVTLPPGQRFDAITLQNGARVVLSGAVELSGTLRLTGNSVLTHPTASEAGLRITAARVVVEAGSAIDVTGRGYLGGNRAGFGERGATVGNQAGALHGNGGSHGGWGAHYVGAGTDATNPTYGDLWHPDKLGSGGGGWSGDGGNGGGYVRIVASEAVVVEGAIRADGGISAGSASGDGSGGSVWISTSRLAGTGAISANGGGNGSHTGGGGGRVAVYADYVDPTADLGGLRNITAWRGVGYYDSTAGSAGTVFVTLAGQTDGDLFVDDGLSGATSSTSTPLPLIGPGVAQAVSADTLTVDGGVVLTAGALVGTRLNPDVTQAETFAIVANTASTISVVTPNEHGAAFADVAAAGQRYAGFYRFDNVIFRRGGQLEVGDRLEVTDTLQLAEFGLLTHPRTTTAYEAELDLTTATLAIDATSRIDVTGRGYLGGNRSGLGETGRTLGNAAGSPHGNGGSYGGLGGHYDGAGGNRPNPVYGSVTDPVELGSGGGAWSGDGGDGGGRVRVAADTLALDGAIVADGAVSVGSASGDGSGGSVNLQVATLTGSGVVRANGGGNGSHIGGGGGRISVRYASQMALPVDHLQARGGDGYFGNGGHGTVFVKGAAQGYGDLVIDGFGSVQPDDTVTIPGGVTFDHIDLRNGVHALADGGLTATDALRLAGYSTLTHSRANEFGLQITAASVVVQAGSAIDVSGRGYPGGNHSGLGESGATLGNVAGSQAGNGGSYGGLGGHYAGSGTNSPNPVYGDLTDPADLGSGGGAWSGAGGGDGGGRIVITAEMIVVDGTIAADGAGSAGSAAGDGSGGSINLQVGTLTGGGVVHANGGGVGSHTAGGGGRIAVHYQTAIALPLDNMQAHGGEGYFSNGGHGTVFLQAASQAAGDLIVDGVGRVAPADTTTIPDGLTFESVTLRDGVRALADDGIEVTGTLQLSGDATLTHSRGHEFGLQIEAGAVIVGTGGAIDVSGRGYPGGNHSGFGESGATLGNVAGAQAGNGGSYGGLGGHYGGSGSNSPNPTYGSAAAPLELGSGGGAWAGAHGGDGGGRLSIVAETVTVDGTITADGNDSQGSAAGGGSGGGVNLRVGDLSGTGVIHAAGGGNGSHTGGGGGRVAIDSDRTITLPLANVSVPGGSGYYGNGDPGTLDVHAP